MSYNGVGVAPEMNDDRGVCVREVGVGVEVWVPVPRETQQRDRETERDRDTERDTDTDRQTDRQTQTERRRQRETKTQTDRQTDTDRHREASRRNCAHQSVPARPLKYALQLVNYRYSPQQQRQQIESLFSPPSLVVWGFMGACMSGLG